MLYTFRREIIAGYISLPEFLRTRSSSALALAFVASFRHKTAQVSIESFFLCSESDLKLGGSLADSLQ